METASQPRKQPPSPPSTPSQPETPSAPSATHNHPFGSVERQSGWKREPYEAGREWRGRIRSILRLQGEERPLAGLPPLRRTLEPPFPLLPLFPTASGTGTPPPSSSCSGWSRGWAAAGGLPPPRRPGTGPRHDPPLGARPGPYQEGKSRVRRQLGPYPPFPSPHLAAAASYWRTCSGFRRETSQPSSPSPPAPPPSPLPSGSKPRWDRRACALSRARLSGASFPGGGRVEWSQREDREGQ